MCNHHRRCPGCNSQRGRAAHNARRRHNRLIKAAVVAHVLGVMGNRELAEELQQKPPKAAKEWAEANGLGTAQLGVEPHKSFRIENQLREGEKPEGEEQVLEGEVISPEKAHGAPVVRPTPAQAAGARPGGVSGGHGDRTGYGGAGQGGEVRGAGGAVRVVKIQPGDVEGLDKVLLEQPAAAVRPRRAQTPSEPAVEPWQKSAGLQRQITAQLTRQGNNPVERLLLDSAPGESKSLGWQGGINETRRVDLGNGMAAYFKPFSGVDRRVERGFGHKNSGQQQIHEVAAWRMAERMGKPYSDLVAPCVLREVDGQLGSLGLERSGATRVLPHEVRAEAPEAVEAAGFFDALVGQQDRHAGNYLYDRTSRRLTLIDHGFSFHTPGSRHNASYLQAERYRTKPKLSAREREICEEVVSSEDVFGLRGVLEPERLDAMRARAAVMLQLGEVLATW